LRQLEPVDVEGFHGSDRRIDVELVIEELIELAVSAPVLPGAASKIDAPLHMVDAGAFPRRQSQQFLLPRYDAPPFPGRPILPGPVFVGVRRTAQRPVEAAAGTVVMASAVFAPYYPGLHPDARAHTAAVAICQVVGAHEVIFSDSRDGRVFTRADHPVFKKVLVSLSHPRSGILP
jgi:hypothetical protein